MNPSVTRDPDIRQLQLAARWLWIAVNVRARELGTPNLYDNRLGRPLGPDDLADEANLPIPSVRVAWEALAEVGALQLDRAVWRVVKYGSRRVGKGEGGGRVPLGPQALGVTGEPLVLPASGAPLLHEGTPEGSPPSQEGDHGPPTSSQSSTAGKRGVPAVDYRALGIRTRLYVRSSTKNLPSERQTARNSPPEPKIRAPRKRDPLVDALAEAFGAASEREMRRMGIAAAELRGADPPVTPEEVPLLVEKWHLLFPGATCTEFAIANRVGMLRSTDPPPRNGRTRDRIVGQSNRELMDRLLGED